MYVALGKASSSYPRPQRLRNQTVGARTSYCTATYVMGMRQGLHSNLHHSSGYLAMDTISISINGSSFLPATIVLSLFTLSFDRSLEPSYRTARRLSRWTGTRSSRRLFNRRHSANPFPDSAHLSRSSLSDHGPYVRVALNFRLNLTP